jgi:ABC-type multidrug transport system ATPase subunit
MIVTHGLTKRFGHFVAVDDVDLEVREGDRYGFLGPNGSGKTTTVRMLLGLVFATSGEIEVLGQAIPRHSAEVLPEVGALIEGPAGYNHLSARMNLSLLDAAGRARPQASRASRGRRIENVLEIVGLAGVGRKPLGQFSLGMRQRLGLAAALLGRPRLLILDEPTNGLDPQGIHEVRDLLLRLNAEGTTVFLSSHLLSEIEQLCDRVGILDRGRLAWQGDLEDLRRPTGRSLVRVSDPVAAVSLLDGRVVGREGDRLVVAGLTVEDLTRALVTKGIGVHEAVPERDDLEQAVLRLTGPGSDRVGGPT